MKKIKNLVIGAGISGISFASFLKTNDYLILEKNLIPGGLCGSFYKKGFIWDYSGHFFHFKTEFWRDFFIEKIGSKNIVNVKKNTKILLKGKLIDYPFQSNINQLDADDFNNCVNDLETANGESGNTFLEMIYNRFGRSICDLFLKPYNEKLYSCNLNLLDKNAMGRFFPPFDKEAILITAKNKQQKTYNDSFLYPLNGCQAIIDCFNPKKMNISYNSPIESIDVENHILKTNNKIYYYKNLIVTAPLNSIYSILSFDNKIDISFSYNKVKIFNIGFSKGLNKESKYFGVHWVYFPEDKYCFYRVGFYNHITSTEKLSLYIEIGFSKNANVKISLNNVLCDLKKAGIVDDSFIVEAYNELDTEPAYVHIETDTNARINKMMLQLKNNNVYFLGRYGKWTYCSIEDCMADSKLLAETIDYE